MNARLDRVLDEALRTLQYEEDEANDLVNDTQLEISALEDRLADEKEELTDALDALRGLKNIIEGLD